LYRISCIFKLDETKLADLRETASDAIKSRLHSHRKRLHGRGVYRRRSGEDDSRARSGALASSVEILNQLGELFLEAVPTVIIVFLFYFFMRWSFFLPMQRVLAERHKRAEGAKVEAEASRAAATEKQRVYADTVKRARGEVFAEQEVQRRRTLDERQATITTARAAAQSALQTAKQGIANDVKAARVELEQTKDNLANDIAEAILAGGPAVPGSSAGSGHGTGAR